MACRERTVVVFLVVSLKGVNLLKSYLKRKKPPESVRKAVACHSAGTDRVPYYYCRPGLIDPGGMSFNQFFNAAPAQVPGFKNSVLKKRLFYSIGH